MFSQQMAQALLAGADVLKCVYIYMYVYVCVYIYICVR